MHRSHRIAAATESDDGSGRDGRQKRQLDLWGEAMGRHSTLGRNRQKPLWRVVTSLLGVASMVGAAAVAGTVISAQAADSSPWSVTASVAPTPDSGAPADATALAALASLSDGSTVQPGDELTYILTVTNSSASGDAVPVTVVDDVSGLQAFAQVT